MKNIKGFVIGLIVLVIIVVVLFLFKMNTNQEIKDDYYMKFVGGSGEIVYTTYLYWEGRQDASYIYTESAARSWGSTEWNERVIKRGYLTFMQGIYKVAEENSSFDYAIINKNVSIPKYKINYKKGDQLSIDQVYKLFNIVGLK